MKEEFTKIYEKQKWGKGKGSGTGSSPKYCEQYLSLLSSLIGPGVRVLDLGCGDWQLYEGFDWRGALYTGVDIVDYIPRLNRDNHPEHTFFSADFSDPEILKRLVLQEAPDLILCKDVLQHWPDEDVWRWLNTIRFLPFGQLIVVNNWKHFRSPEKNGTPRDINNQYRWAPIDMREYDFEVLGYYPKGKYKQIAVLKGQK